MISVRVAVASAGTTTITDTGPAESIIDSQVQFNTDGTHFRFTNVGALVVLPNCFLPTTVGVGAGYYIRVTTVSGPKRYLLVTHIPFVRESNSAVSVPAQMPRPPRYGIGVRCDLRPAGRSSIPKRTAAALSGQQATTVIAAATK